MKILLIFLLIVCVIVIHDAIRIRSLLAESAILQKSIPFEKRIPGASKRILVIGDSTAVGTGAETNLDSTAGRMSLLYPEAEILNKGINGQRIHTVASMDLESLGMFDIVLIQVGANDITHFTPLPQVEADLNIVLEKAGNISSSVIILHSGRVGNAPFFPKYISWIFNLRSKQMRNMYMRVSEERDVEYIDLYGNGADNVFTSDPDRFYATDKFHPSSDGYEVWFEKIKEKLL